MNCPACGEQIQEYQDTRECDICGCKMHATCAADRPSPVEAFLRRIYSSRRPECPTTYCFCCYEIETVMVRLAMLGQTLTIIPGVEHAPAVARVNAEWDQQYAAILDAWPREPQPQPAEDDAIWVERMIREN
jgi:hypothetical protein